MLKKESAGKAQNPKSKIQNILAGGLLVREVHAQTQDAANNVNAVAAAAGVQTTDLFTIIGRIINIALGFVGVVLLGLLLYAGYLWMTAGGDPAQVEKAKKFIGNAIVGLIIIVSSFAIVNFILAQLGGVLAPGGGIGGAVPGAGGFPGSAGSLGSGIIEYHVPVRDATGVPRNTQIIVTFKQPIKVSSFIKDYAEGSTSTVGLNNDAVKIYPTGSLDKSLTTAQARVRFTADHKTFVIRPVEFLGNPTVSMPYTVELRPGTGGILLENGTPAFTGSFGNGYVWQFEVSTVVDNTPPQVTSVIPSSGGRYAPNIVVQINFNEPIDPTTASGQIKDGAGFSNLELASTPAAGGATTKPNGEFKVSNGYTTVEFVSDLPCGINSCGRKIYCLPSSAAVNVTAKAATLSDAPPLAELTASGYDGLTDVAGNSLDGNANGKAEGQGTDNYAWSFGTGDKPNLEAPRVTATNPPAGDRVRSSNIRVDLAPTVDFDSVLQASTITSDSALIRSNEPPIMTDTWWWTPRQALLTADGRVASSTDAVAAGRVLINHRLYMAATSTFTPEYDPFLLSDIQNVYQNCFNPSSSKACKGVPNCCEEKASLGACTFPPTK